MPSKAARTPLDTVKPPDACEVNLNQVLTVGVFASIYACGKLPVTLKVFDELSTVVKFMPSTNTSVAVELNGFDPSKNCGNTVNCKLIILIVF